MADAPTLHSDDSGDVALRAELRWAALVLVIVTFLVGRTPPISFTTILSSPLGPSIVETIPVIISTAFALDWSVSSLPVFQA